MGNSKISSETKIDYVEKYKAGKISAKEIAEGCQVNITTVRSWVRNYDVFGAIDIDKGSVSTRYSQETRLMAVRDYLDGKGSLRDICAKHKLRSNEQLRVWIKLYNGHKDLRSRGGKRSEVYMTKGRSTLLDERIEIVCYCIAHNKDYSKTMEKYKVSYQQIDSWVSKYEKKSVEGLVDRRGKRKAQEEMTEVERLRAENKLFQAEIEQKVMEIDLLKKLEELERRRR